MWFCFTVRTKVAGGSVGYFEEGHEETFLPLYHRVNEKLENQINEEREQGQRQ